MGEYNKRDFKKRSLLERPIHIISANLHSVMNTLYAPIALKAETSKTEIFKVYEALSQSDNKALRKKSNSKSRAARDDLYKRYFWD